MLDLIIAIERVMSSALNYWDGNNCELGRLRIQNKMGIGIRIARIEKQSAFTCQSG